MVARGLRPAGGPAGKADYLVDDLSLIEPVGVDGEVGEGCAGLQRCFILDPAFNEPPLIKVEGVDPAYVGHLTLCVTTDQSGAGATCGPAGTPVTVTVPDTDGHRDQRTYWFELILDDPAVHGTYVVTVLGHQ